MTKHTEPVYHVISNTHWDREWRFPFQRNRQMLVDMIDAVIDILEKEPEYRAFHLDSQSIVIRDYLEAKPHMKERFIKLVTDNRLHIGPWYILPDQFQVGGENHVRNLLLGHRICAEHGGVSKIGYSPFSWGQISQLPQIYKSFNIDLIMFYRGVNALESPKSEFLWEGADGTRMVTSRFSTMPRYNFYFYIYRPVIHNEDPFNCEYKWSTGGTPFHFADQEQQDEDFFIVKPVDGYYPEQIDYWVNRLRSEQDEDFTTPHKIWMEGHDSSGPNIKTVRALKDIREKLGLNVQHSTLEDYARSIAESVDVEQLKLVTGERRSAQANRRSGNMFGYTTSARMYLKQKNFDAERWTQYYAEPFNIFSGLAGRDIRDQYMEMAWEKILQNAAHDSIGGCSLDAIHDDMMHRYKEVIEISRGVFERAMKYLVLKLNTDKFIGAEEQERNDKVFLVVANPTNFERSEVAEAFLDIPQEFDQTGLEIVDEQGNALSYQLIERVEHAPVLEQMTNRPLFFSMVRYRAYVHLPQVPAFGMKVFRVKPAATLQQSAAALAASERLLENEYIKVEVADNGTLSVLDKQSGASFKDLAYLYDEGDAGHAWVLEPVAPFITTLQDKPVVTLLENGPLKATIRIAHQMQLPAHVSDRKAGNGNMVAVPATLEVTLTHVSKRVDLKLEVDNRAESHRLRLMFPTDLTEATHSYGEGQFDVLKRSLERPDTSDWVEQPMYDFPMHHFVDLTDGKHGAAILVDGLKEYEVCADGRNTMAITLLRSFDYIINPAAPQDYSYEKGVQCLGKQTYRLSFMPHAGDWQQGDVFQEAQRFNYALRLVQTGRLHGELGSEVSFLEIENKDVVFSTLKKPQDMAEDAAVLRLYNPTEQTQRTKVRWNSPLKGVQSVSLEELQPEAVALLDAHTFEVELAPKKIATLRMQH